MLTSLTIVTTRQNASKLASALAAQIVPDGVAVFHEGRRHVADALDGADVGAFDLLVDGILTDAGKEGVEAVAVGRPRRSENGAFY